MADYQFYIQICPYKGTDGKIYTQPRYDLEDRFHCLYKQFKDFAFDGDIKNIYTESYAEQSGDRVWTPYWKDLEFSSYDCTLELLFKGDQCQTYCRSFYEYIRGRLIEYYDTFRKRYVTLLLIKKPEIQQEILYGDSKYMLVSFTFRNVYGRSFEETQIKTTVPFTDEMGVQTLSDIEEDIEE